MLFTADQVSMFIAKNNELLALVASMRTGSKKPDVPNFVALGEQSAGKSSVLQSFTQRDFLPKGEGIVTRRPCEITCTCTGPGGEEFVTFEHTGSRRFYTDAEIACEIDKATNDKCGPYDISEEPIMLMYRSPRVQNISLVDLPGKIEAASEGMCHDAKQKIDAMVAKYARRPNSIILAVSPATQDPVASKAIAVSKEYDPKGERTLGVLTKVNMMPDKSNLVNVLNGTDTKKAPTLKLGYVAVINPGPDEKGMDLAAAREHEMAWFHNRPDYKPLLGSTKLGTKALQYNMETVLVQTIYRAYPEMKEENDRLLDEAKSVYEKLKPLLDPLNRERLLKRGLRDASDELSDRLHAASGARSYDKRNRTFSTGMRVDDIFIAMPQKIDTFMIEQSACYRPTFGQLRRELRKVKGIDSFLTDTDDAFRSLVVEQIKLLDGLCASIVNRVADVLKEAIQDIAFEESIALFPLLTDRIKKDMIAVMEDKRKSTLSLVKGVLKAETSRINVEHPDFCMSEKNRDGFMRDMRELSKRKGHGYGSDQKLDDPIRECAVKKQKQKAGALFKPSWQERHLRLCKSGHLIWWKIGRKDVEQKKLSLEKCIVTYECEDPAEEGAPATAAPLSSGAKAKGRRVLTISGGALTPHAQKVEFESETEAKLWKHEMEQIIEKLAKPASTDTDVVARETEECRKEIRQLSEDERIRYYMLTHMLDSKLKIVQKNLSDFIPKVIQENLICASEESVKYLDDKLGYKTVEAAIGSLMVTSDADLKKFDEAKQDIEKREEIGVKIQDMLSGAKGEATQAMLPTGASPPAIVPTGPPKHSNGNLKTDSL